MNSIPSNLDGARKIYGEIVIADPNCIFDSGYYPVIVRTKTGHSAGKPHQFEVMLRKINERDPNDNKGFIAYYLIDRNRIDSLPRRINYDEEGVLCLLE